MGENLKAPLSDLKPLLRGGAIIGNVQYVALRIALFLKLTE